MASLLTPTTRRNGTVPSCEPCRKSKVRCDHRKPVCGRCASRNQVTKCVYHPAPMTKDRTTPRRQEALENALLESVIRVPPTPTNTSHSSGQPRPPTSADRCPAAHGHRQPTGSLLALPEQTTHDDSPFQGPTTFAAVLNEFSRSANAACPWLTDAIQTANSRSVPSLDAALIVKSARLVPHLIASSEVTVRVVEGAALLGQLAGMNDLGDIIAQYYALTIGATIPYKFVLKALDELRSFQDLKKDQLLEISAKLFANTTKPWKVDSSITPETFDTLFTGPNLRWEIIGIICVLAGSMADNYVGRGRVRADTGRSSDQWSVLCDLFLHAAERCLSFVSHLQYDHMQCPNELWLFMLMMHVGIISATSRNSSYQTWERLGDLTTTVYAMGIHQEEARRGIPFFLRQLRRRAYAGVYYYDKAIATYSGRPPRLLKRFSICPLPLDLEDDELLSDPVALERAISALDEDGWNREGVFSPATFCRLRFMNATLREEVLDLSMGNDVSNIDQRAKDISRKAEDMWLSLPAFWRYDETMWAEGFDVRRAFIQVHTYLDYTHTRFLLQLALVRSIKADPRELFNAARTLLSTALIMYRESNQMDAYGSAFLWHCNAYGLPSSAVLAIELLQQKQEHREAQSPFPRAEVIRNLSVFLSSLEWISRPFKAIGLGETSKDAHRTLTKILDLVLDESAPVAAATAADLGSDPHIMEDIFGQWPDADAFLDSLNVIDWDTSAWNMT